MEIKEYLLYLKEEKGISYKKIAEKIGFTNHYISDIIHDRRNAGRHFIEALYRVYPKEEK